MDKSPIDFNVPILDAHHHFWQLDGTGTWPWLQDDYNKDFFLGDYHKMCQTFMPAEYKRATHGWNVIGTIHCEAERARTEQVEESAWLLELHQEDPAFPCAVVAHADFLQPDLDEILSGHAEISLVRGIRSKPTIARGPGQSMTGPGTLHDSAWVKGLHKLMDYGFSWDLRVPWYHLEEAAAVVADIPETPVIVNHCGLPLDRSAEGMKAWRQGMERLAKLPNTFVKVSELGLPGNRWDRHSNEAVVRDTVRLFGYERSMFASNLPVGTLTAASFDEIMHTVLAAVQGATHGELCALFHGTAAKVYGVDLKAVAPSMAVGTDG